MKTKRIVPYFRQNNNPQKTMTERKLDMLEKIIGANKHGWGPNIEVLDKKVLQKLIDDDIVILKLDYNGAKTTHRCAYAKNVPEPVVERVPEPYKKRRADLKAAGMRYRKSV